MEQSEAPRELEREIERAKRLAAGVTDQRRLLNCRYFSSVTTVGVDQVWSSDMLVRPRDLADQMYGWQELLTLPLDAARCKAREIVDQAPRSGLTPIIKKWRQLPDGQIEFAIRYFPAGGLTRTMIRDWQRPYPLVWHVDNRLGYNLDSWHSGRSTLKLGPPHYPNAAAILNRQLQHSKFESPTDAET